MTSWEETIKLLNDNHIYPSNPEMLNGKKIVALQVDTAPIMMTSRKEYIEKVLGPKFKVDNFTNEGYIKITKRV